MVLHSRTRNAFVFGTEQIDMKSKILTIAFAFVLVFLMGIGIGSVNAQPAPAPAPDAVAAPAAPADAAAPPTAAGPGDQTANVENPYGLAALWKTGDFVSHLVLFDPGRHVAGDLVHLRDQVLGTDAPSRPGEADGASILVGRQS